MMELDGFETFLMCVIVAIVLFAVFVFGPVLWEHRKNDRKKVEK